MAFAEDELPVPPKENPPVAAVPDVSPVLAAELPVPPKENPVVGTMLP
jgi:hypothetical protein